MSRKKTILTLINEAAADENHRVTVLPLMCGTGKSGAISQKIKECIQHKTGLLIVTDRTSRFNDYLSPYDKSLKEYIQKNIKKTLALTAETVMGAGQYHSNYTILMMTSQRYFSLSQNELLEYLHWNKGERQLVIFDEKPNIYFQYELSLGTVNKFESALILGVNTKETQVEKKDWICDYWAFEKMRFLVSLSRAEVDLSEGDSSSSVYGIDLPTNESLITLTDDMDEEECEKVKDFNGTIDRNVYLPKRFENFIRQNRHLMYKYNQCDAISFVRAFSLLPDHAQLYSYRSRESGEYKSYFSIIESEQKKFTDIPAKCVILDGTADLSMDYNVDWLYMNKQAAKPHIRKIPNLKLILVNERTSRKTLRSRGAKRLERFINYVKKDSGSNKVCIFSYKDIISAYKTDFYGDDGPSSEEKYDYEGNLKGRNDFQNHTVFGQVGIFILPPSYYLSIYLAQNPTIKEKLIENPKCVEILRDLTMQQDFKTAMYNDILADIEQNIFRSPIRTSTFTGEVKYYLFFDCDVHSILKDLIIQRFHEQYGATVILQGATYEFGIEKTLNRKSSSGELSTPQKLINAVYNTPSGDYPIREWLARVGIEKKQFDSAKQYNTFIREMFESMCIDKHKGIYRFKNTKKQN